MDDGRFEDLRFQIDPQSGPNRIIAVVDIVAARVDGSNAADIRSAAGIVAGRPQPPPAITVIRVYITPLRLGILCRFTLPGRIRGEVLVGFRDAEQKNLVLRGISRVCVKVRVLVRTDSHRRDHGLLVIAEGRIQEAVIQPFSQ